MENEPKTEIQIKVEEAARAVSQSYERKMASLTSQLSKLHRELADMDDFLHVYQESANETISKLQLELEEVKERIKELESVETKK
jgi:exonuclease VII small subunit